MGERPICELCGRVILWGEKYASSWDGDTCFECTPTYQDILDSPESFGHFEDDPFSPDEAREIVNDHLTNGGLMTDSLADRIAMESDWVDAGASS